MWVEQPIPKYNFATVEKIKRNVEMSNFFAKFNLQNPLWQGIGAIVSIIALIVSSFITYDIYQKSVQISELTIERGYSFDPIDFGESSNRRIKMSVNGEPISNARVYYYTLTNTGKTPITPNDYTEPIKISIKKPFRILTVEKSTSKPKSIVNEWSKIDDSSFQLKPLLLNPRDSFTTLVFVSTQANKSANKETKTDSSKKTLASNETNSDDDMNPQQLLKTEPIWTARIVNISDLKITKYGQRREEEAKSLGIFYTTFHQRGWGVYRFAGLTLILFTIGLFLGVQFGVLQKPSLIYYVLLSSLMGLSVVTADNFASRIEGEDVQPIVSNFSVILYLFLLIFFISPIMKKNKQSNSMNNP